jgi:hypothetical protein
MERGSGGENQQEVIMARWRVGVVIGGIVLLGLGTAQAQSGWAVLGVEDYTPVFETVTQGQYLYDTFSLSPTQNHLAWLSLNNELCLCDFAQETSTCTPLPAAYGEAQAFTRPLWSPDQQRLTLNTTPLYDDERPARVWLYSTADRTFADLTPAGATWMVYRMVWSDTGTLYVVGYRHEYSPAGDSWLTPAYLYRWQTGDRQLADLLDLGDAFANSEIVDLAAAPEGHALAVLGISTDADYRYGGLWVIDLRDLHVEQVAKQRDLRLGLPEGYLYALYPETVTWSDHGMFVTLTGAIPFDPIGVIVTAFDPDQGTLTPLFSELVTLREWDFSDPRPATGQVTPDGRFFIYAAGDANGPKLWARPLPPDGSASVLMADPFFLDCGLTYTRITIRQGETVTPYVLRFAQGCGE